MTSVAEIKSSLIRGSYEMYVKNIPWQLKKPLRGPNVYAGNLLPAVILAFTSDQAYVHCL